MVPPDRYSRQSRFAGLGKAGQMRVEQSTVAILGCGALGTVQADLLARAGCGRLILIDRDFVELSNLQRQVLFDESDARDGLPKVIAAANRLKQVNSEVAVETHVADCDASNIHELLAAADVVLDATDNFETRFLLNDYCVSAGKNWVYGAAVGSYGIVMPIVPGRGVCLRCIYPTPPSGPIPTCETSGILNTATSIVAALQVTAAMQMLAMAESVRFKITTIDVWDGPLREVSQPARDPDCTCCGRRDFEFLRTGRRAPISLCGRNAVQIHERNRPVNLPELASRLREAGSVRANEFALRFTNDEIEMTVFPDGRAIVKGTTDPGVARSVYSRFIGN